MAARLPIVFLPGVMGSRLYFEASQKFWDPDSTWRMLRLDARLADSVERRQPPRAPRRQSRWRADRSARFQLNERR